MSLLTSGSFPCSLLTNDYTLSLWTLSRTKIGCTSTFPYNKFQARWRSSFTARVMHIVLFSGSVVFQFYGPGNAYHSLLLDAGDTDYVGYDPTRFNLVVRKPLYDKLVRYVILRPNQWRIPESAKDAPPVKILSFSYSFWQNVAK